MPRWPSATTRSRAWRIRSTTSSPTTPTNLRHGRGHPRDRGQRRVPGVGSRIRQEHHHLLRAFQRPVGRHRRQPAQVHGRRARHQRQPQGRAFHPLLRCVQHSDRDPGGRSGLPAGYDPGVRRRHHSWRETALRILRGYGSQGHRHAAQGVRRRLYRDVVEAHPR